MNHGSPTPATGLISLETTSDNRFRRGENGVERIEATGDRKVEFVHFASDTLAHVRSSLGYPAYYPVHPVEIRKPVTAVLMDLDGTTVRSEEFWIWIIEQTTSSLLSDPNFHLAEEDFPHVSGHSVSEHLQYCLSKYCPTKTVEEAREQYYVHTRREMDEILDGRGRADAFKPSPGVKPFLMELKRRGIRLGLVTSGVYEKAWPEIVSAFRTLEMGDPQDFYDASISAGFPLGRGQVGTLGELCPKPHPWLYAETARVGLGIPFEERGHVVGIEDSGAGVCSIRLAGFAAIGIAGGNIQESGAQSLCSAFCADFEEILRVID